MSDYLEVDPATIRGVLTDLFVQPKSDFDVKEWLDSTRLHKNNLISCFHSCDLVSQSQLQEQHHTLLQHLSPKVCYLFTMNFGFLT